MGIELEKLSNTRLKEMAEAPRKSHRALGDVAREYTNAAATVAFLRRGLRLTWWSWLANRTCRHRHPKMNFSNESNASIT